MIFGLIEIALLLAGGSFLYQDYRNGLPKTKRLMGWVDQRVGLLISAVNTPEKKIDRLMSGLNRDKQQLEERIADIKARADQFENSAKEATMLVNQAGNFARIALMAQNKAVSESRQADAGKNEQIYKALIAQIISNENLAEQYNQAAEDAREAAAGLEEELEKVRVQSSLGEALAAQAKANLAIAGAYNSINQFLVGSRDGSDGKNGLKQLSNAALFERSKGKHLLAIRKSDPDGSTESAFLSGQVLFPPEVEKAAEEFRERHLLMPPPENKDESAN